jgi:hypothetical protein
MAEQTCIVTFTTTFDLEIEVDTDITDEKEISNLAYEEFVNMPDKYKLDYVMGALQADIVEIIPNDDDEFHWESGDLG